MSFTTRRKNKDVGLKISEGRVKLGIDADKSIAVLRKEVVEAAKDENRESIQKVQLDKEKLKNVIKL